MITVENLTKTYTSKNKNKCTALNNVNFTLDNVGMVFISGKSGSGKSTLLNLLGGLDKFTSGDIIVNGNRFSSFTEKDYCNFRNTSIGFIFQDYCLFEQMTVKDNLLFTLDLQSKTDKGTVREVLSRLKIEDLENRYINELSGGQQQRVAIARALIKNPDYILADEPTGNLDSKNAKIVLDELKEISKTNLVIVVSHNLDDAEKYADRIIEISDGQIVQDKTRASNIDDNLYINDDNIVLPVKRRLTNEELTILNDKIINGGVTLSQSPEKFLQTKNIINTDTPNNNFKKYKFSRKRLFKYSHKIFGNKPLSVFMVVIFMSFLITIFGVCQSLANFDKDVAVNKALSKEQYDTFVLQKAYESHDLTQNIKKDKIVNISDSDVKTFEKSNLFDKVYPLYAYTLSCDNNTFNMEYGLLRPGSNYKNIFAKEIKGVLICDEEYLKKIYGDENGNIKYSATANDQKRAGLIITDYIADSILYYDNKIKSYNDIIGKERFHDRAYINSIIDTGYKDRYLPLIKKLIDAYKNKLPKNEIKKILHSDDYSKFYEEITTNLNVAYSFNSNFVEDSIAPEYRLFTMNRNCIISNSENDNIYDEPYFFCDYASRHPHLVNKPKDNEIIVPPMIYNALFGTKITDPYNNDEFVPNKQITITKYQENQSLTNKDYEYEMTFTITELTSIPNLIVSDNIANEMRKYDIIPYELYFSGVNNPSALYHLGEDNMFVPQMKFFDVILLVSNIANALSEFFVLITVLVCVIGVVYLVAYAFGNIRKRAYEIGVTRALGGKISDIVFMFIIQIIIICLLICIFASVGLILTIKLSNTIFVNNFSHLFEASLITGMEIVQFYPLAIVIDLALVVCLTMLSAIIPVIAIRKVKPINIIKAKN